MVAAIRLRVRTNAGLTWRWFQYWRKRYMWLRLAIIALIFAPPVYEVHRPLTRELVVIAIKGIESAKYGPGRYADYYKFQEKKQLQRRLLTHFDLNRNSHLEPAEVARLRSQTDLSATAITGRGIDVELDPLLAANHKLGLVPRDLTGNAIRRKALDHALADMEAEHELLMSEVKPNLDMQYPGWRDYLKWTTWKRGLDLFRSDISYLRGLSPGRYFDGIQPSGVEWEFITPRPRWYGYLGWIALLAMVMLCVRRYGKGEVLERRFKDDPEFALAPCPICRTDTHDYGALKEHRWSRAWATAVVLALAGVAISAIREPSPVSATTLVLAGVAASIVRYLLWPREVHALHRRHWLLAVGFTASVVLVVSLLEMIALFVMQSYA